MAEAPEKLRQDDYFKDHLVIRHPNGQSEKFSLPDDEEKTIRIGRELDNDVVLVDPRASRYHAELRRTAGSVEIKDLHSANGTIIGATRIEPETWEKLSSGQAVQMAETRIYWEKAASSQSTVAMAPAQRPAAASAGPPPVAASAPGRRPATLLPWVIGLGVLLVLLIVGGIFFSSGFGDGGAGEVTGPVVEAPGSRGTESNLSLQTPGGGPTPTQTPSGPQLAIPRMILVSAEVRPIILGALPSTDQALLLVNVRVENVGNAPFTVSTDDFSIRTSDGKILPEAGGNTSQEGLRRLGAIDRFNNLNLMPGGSVAESLLFEVEADTYESPELVFEPKDLEPIVLGLQTVHAGRELAVALGTPFVEEETPVAVAAAATPTSAPTPTPTRPAIIPAPQVVPRSALVGTIAYAVFNGTDYDLYFGQADGSGTRFYRPSASQPAFSHDGQRIAFHSWAGDSRGLVAMDVSGANANLIANFIEDQLPTWTVDNQNIIFLSRRSGGRQSQLIRADANTERAEGTIIGEGEYPMVSSNGQMVFKGWGNTAFGLRLASITMENVQTVTNVDEDTAPALSPDGQKIVFMSRREGNWEVYLVNADGSGLLRLTDDPAEDGLPTWSPDGNAIAFVSNRGGPWAVWAMLPDGSGQRQLFTMEGSPDGFVGTDNFASRGWAEERISWTR